MAAKIFHWSLLAILSAFLRFRRSWTFKMTWNEHGAKRRKQNFGVFYGTLEWFKGGGALFSKVVKKTYKKRPNPRAGGKGACPLHAPHLATGLFWCPKWSRFDIFHKILLQPWSKKYFSAFGKHYFYHRGYQLAWAVEVWRGCTLSLLAHLAQ